MENQEKKGGLSHEECKEMLQMIERGETRMFKFFDLTDQGHALASGFATGMLDNIKATLQAALGDTPDNRSGRLEQQVTS